MPFQSQAQSRACFAGAMPGVDCEEWAAKTNYKKLPKKKSPKPQEKIAAWLEKESGDSYALIRQHVLSGASVAEALMRVCGFSREVAQKRAMLLLPYLR